MPGINEALKTQSQLRGALHAGIDAISQDQEIVFVKYVRTVLPFDGYVFWVKADLLSQAALQNVSNYNRWLFNQPLQTLVGAPRFAASGSFHYATFKQQEPDEDFSLNKVIFTAKQQINDLNTISPMVMYVAEIDGIKYAFRNRESFYEQADVFHYEGDAVYPTLENQIIDSTRGFDTGNIIVSNSLPIWLALNKLMPVFPSYLVPTNFPPPYAAIDILEGSPRALQAIPWTDANSNHWQLVCDRVRVTIFGLRNFNALDYQDYVFQQSLDTEIFGLMNTPVIRDEKRKQTELNIISQKKSIEFEISYYQVRIREVARQLILSCIPTFIIAPQDPTVVHFVTDLPLSYEGPFQDGEVLPRILFMDTTVLTRGIAFTNSTGNGVFNLYDQAGNLQITVTCVAGNHNPQVSFVNGPVTFYINQYLTVVAPTPTDVNLTDLAITLGTNP